MFNTYAPCSGIEKQGKANIKHSFFHWAIFHKLLEASKTIIDGLKASVTDAIFNEGFFENNKHINFDFLF